ncbi:MAG: VWA domain-containing protein [DPANN group archaeon]|nr:VWA domain-containing protein [DPANN group archaeon]
MAFDTSIPVSRLRSIEELQGKLSISDEDDKLMHSVMENDQQAVDDGNLIEESINQGLGGFTPNMFYEQLVKNYRNAEHLYGKRLLQIVTGYDPRYLKKNLKIPEFQRQVRQVMEDRFRQLKNDGLLNKDGAITDKGFAHTSWIVVLQELDNLLPRGYFGEKIRKRPFAYGLRDEIHDYRKGDLYKDLDVRRSVRKALLRHHGSLVPEDLQMYRRKAKGKVTIIFALDASSSMRGAKLRTCKRAGISLAFNATQNKDEVGIIVFGSDVKTSLEPTDDFSRLLHEIIRIRATTQTNIRATIDKAITLFPHENTTKHLVLLTDTQPTTGNKPRDDTLQAIGQARAAGITVSLVGISLDKEAEELAQKMVELGQGRLYSVSNLDDVGQVVLEDYYAES